MLTRTCSIIFSKNKPIQLFATLESFQMNIIDIKDHHVFVIVYCSDENHICAYKNVKYHFPKFIFIQEKEFKKDLHTLLCNPYFTDVLFLTDKDLINDQKYESQKMSIIKQKSNLLHYNNLDEFQQKIFQINHLFTAKVPSGQFLKKYYEGLKFDINNMPHFELRI